MVTMALPSSKRICFIAILTLTFVGVFFVAAHAEDTPDGTKKSETGIVNFLDQLENVVEDKTLWFYRYFGSHLNRNKIVGVSADTSCDYDDPEKIKFCPPMPKSPFPDAKGQRKKISTAPKATAKALTNTENEQQEEKDDLGGISPLLLTKCLDNPADPDCVRLLQDGTTQAASAEVKPKSTNFVTSMPTGTSENLATQEPTRDDCYGNMLDGRFCTSEMPSISEEPTVIPRPTVQVPPGETAFTESQPTQHNFTTITSIPTCKIDIHNIDNSPNAMFGNPLALVGTTNTTNTTVTFSLSQTWKRAPVDYIHIVFLVPPDGEKRKCDQIKQVPFGQTNKE